MLVRVSNIACNNIVCNGRCFRIVPHVKYQTAPSWRSAIAEETETVAGTFADDPFLGIRRFRRNALLAASIVRHRTRYVGNNISGRIGIRRKRFSGSNSLAQHQFQFYFGKDLVDSIRVCSLRFCTNCGSRIDRNVQ